MEPLGSWSLEEAEALAEPEVLPDARGVALAMAADHRPLGPRGDALVVALALWAVPGAALLAAGAAATFDAAAGAAATFDAAAGAAASIDAAADHRPVLAAVVASTGPLAVFTALVAAWWTLRAWRNGEALGTDLTMRWTASAPADVVTTVPLWAAVISVHGIDRLADHRQAAVVLALAATSTAGSRAVGRAVVQLWRSSSPPGRRQRPPGWVVAWWWSGSLAVVGGIALVGEVLPASWAGPAAVITGAAVLVAVPCGIALVVAVGRRQRARFAALQQADFSHGRPDAEGWSDREALARFNRLYHHDLVAGRS
jgi:hypothetical protein